MDWSTATSIVLGLWRALGDAIRLDDPAECTRQVRILVDEYEGLDL